MGLFTRKRQEAESIAREMEMPENETSFENKKVVSREKFVLDTKTVNSDSSEMGELPIYEIYRKFQEDWETKGYANAKVFPETSYRENQKRVIVDNLRLAIKEALIRYEDKITDIDSHIKHAENNGLIETLEKYKQERKKLVAHRDELANLDEDAKEIGEKTAPILASYDMGFTRGMVSLSNEKVEEIMNKVKYE